MQCNTRVNYGQRIMGFLVVMLMSHHSLGKIVTETIDYKVEGETYRGVLAYDNSTTKKRPGVLVVHEWWGMNEYAQKRAQDLAKAGYVAFALDMYGVGKLAKHPDKAKAFMTATLEKAGAVKNRFLQAKNLLESRPEVDAKNIAAIGYCFGGGVVLEMARAGVDLRGVASFHGSLGTKNPAQLGKVKAQVRVYNGGKDPFVTDEQAMAFKKEMSAAKVNYEFTSYPAAVHSFTNPGATAVGKKFGLPVAYDERADKSSWKSMLAFFDEIFTQ